MIEIVYETHALTTDNEAGIATGWLPGALSEAGRSLARELGARRRGTGLAAVFVSDLQRAVETAAIAFAGDPIPLYPDARLRECDYGAWNGMPVARLAAERRRRIDEPFPGGQSYRDVVDGMASFLHELAAGWQGKRVLLISHSANRWALDYLLNGRPLEELVGAPFDWREGWEYVLPDRWAGMASHPDR